MQAKAPDSPAPAEGWLTTTGLNLHYLHWGGDGPPVLALHGLAASCHWYDLVLPHLRDRLRCVAIDLRGHGETDQPASGYDWRTLARDVAGALDHLGIGQAAPVGHSWGANIAVAVAAFYPERVSRLALIEGGFLSGPHDSGMTWERFKARRRRRTTYGPKERYLRALQRRFPDCWSEHLERMLLSMVRLDHDGTVYERLEPQNHEQVLCALWTEPPSLMLPRIRCPALLIAAERHRQGLDEKWLRLRREQVQAAQDAITHRKVVWVPGARHDIAYQRPREIAGIVQDFLLA